MKLYTVEGCPFCIELKGRLGDMNYKYEEIDVDLDENEEEFNIIMSKTGNDSVPVVLVDDTLLAPDVSFEGIDELMSIIEDLHKL